MAVDEKVFALMHEHLPPYFCRADVDKVTNGIVSSKTLANLASSNAGPTAHYMGRKCVYIKDEFLEWFYKYYSNIAGPETQLDALTRANRTETVYGYKSE